MIFTDAKQVMDLLEPIIAKYKTYDSKHGSKKNYKCKIDDLPDFYPNYKTACKYAERIKIHSETGSFPEELFHNRYPNQTDKEFKYMKSNYKQNTLPVFVDYISTITRPFSDGNWSIEWPVEDPSLIKAKETLRDYLENDIEVVRSLKEFVRGLLPSLKSVDANGVIAVRPEKIYTLESTDEDGNQITVVDNTKRVSPQPYYFPVKQVLSDTKYDDDYFILESTEKSVVDYAGTKANKGHVFEVYDENNIWVATQVGKFDDYEFDIQVYYTHGAGSIAATRLKGIPQYLNGSYIWQSPFMYACDLLDLALMNAQYLQCSLAQRMFPYLVMLGSKCEFKEKDGSGAEWSCDGGWIFDASSPNGKKECPGCHGSGLKDRLSPMGVMKIEPATSEPGSETEMKMMDKAMYYVEPPTQSAEFVFNKIESDLSKAYDVIKAKRVSQATGAGIDPGSGTATKEILDQKAQHAAVKLFIDQAFSIYDFLLEHIGIQRYSTEFKKPVLIAPTHLDFNTEADYIDKITKALNAGLPPPVIENMMYGYLQTIYFNNQSSAKAFNLIRAVDRLLVLKNDDLLVKLSRGLYQNWQIVLHDSSSQLIDELLIEHADAEFCDVDDCTKGFFSLDFEEQKRLIVEKAKKWAEETKTVQPSLLDRARLGALPPAA